MDIANAEKQQNQNRRKKCQSENIEQTIVCQSERWTTNKPSLECNEKCKTKPFNYQKKILFLLQPHKINEKEKQKTLFLYLIQLFLHIKPNRLCLNVSEADLVPPIHLSISPSFSILFRNSWSWNAKHEVFFMLNHFVNHLFCEM